MFLDNYGTERSEEGIEALEWDPATIKMEIEDDFKINLPNKNLDKIMSGIILITTDRFYKVLPDFIHICNVLSGSTFDPTIFDPADAYECAWGITESLLLGPPEEEEDEEPFSEEILTYISETVKDEGLLQPPDILKLSLKNYTPTDIYSEFSDDPIMFNSIYDIEKRKEEDINKTIKMRLETLIDQIESLKLNNGNTKELSVKLRKSLWKA